MCSMLLRHLLGVFTLTFLATGAFAQIQEIVPPTLSSGLPNANAAATPLSEKPEQLSAPQSVLNAASLPPIDAIGLGSDIRPFLDPGVPQSLTREALRRAWVTDPPIRAGSRYEQVARFLGKDVRTSFEVTALEDGRLVLSGSMELDGTPHAIRVVWERQAE